MHEVIKLAIEKAKNTMTNNIGGPFGASFASRRLARSYQREKALSTWASYPFRSELQNIF